jgi:4-carboxymuconolactone decarboxylase
MPESASTSIEIAILGAALVLARDEVATDRLQSLRRHGVPRETVREAILQTYLFDGFPTALEGMRLLSDLWPGAPEPSETGNFNDGGLWLERGVALHQQIYGSLASRVLANAHSLSPELAHWMLVEGYGKVLSRPGLGIVSRELVAVAILSVKHRPRQLHSHLRGALRVGCAVELLRRLLDAMQSTFGNLDLSAEKELLDRVIGGGDAPSR